MKIKTIFILILLPTAFGGCCLAQRPRLLNADSAGFIHVDTNVNYWVIPTVVEQGSNKPFTVRHIIVLHDDCIYNGLYKPKKEALRLFGREDVIRIILKPQVRILSFHDVLKKYHISKKYLNCAVFIDQHQLYPVQPLMAAENAIDTMEVIKDRLTRKIFISIITNN